MTANTHRFTRSRARAGLVAVLLAAAGIAAGAGGCKSSDTTSGAGGRGGGPSGGAGGVGARGGAGGGPGGFGGIAVGGGLGGGAGAAVGGTVGAGGTTSGGGLGGRNASGGAGGATAAGGGGAGGGGGAICSVPVGSCFTTSHWQIDNISPCIYTIGTSSTPNGAISTVHMGPLYACPSDLSMAPSTSWATDTLLTDCPGHYRMCFTIKAGDPANPLPTDCTFATSCAEGDYATAGVTQIWPDLPSWISPSAQASCVVQFYNGGGYGEESVTGTPTGCATLAKTITRVTYCPQSCFANPSAPGCSTCMAGGSG